jgi:hypothetical protein
MNPLPLTVNVNAAPPAVAELGTSPLVVGTGLLPALMVNVWALEVPPPGAGLNTVTWAVPAAAMSVAGIDAVNWVEEINVVARSAPFQRTTEFVTKLVPFTVNVNAAPPAVAELGASPLVVGTGLLLALIVNVCALEVPPPGVGLNTVTDAVPAIAMSVARIAACS